MIYDIKSTSPNLEIELKGRLTFSDYGTFREISECLTQYNPKSCRFDLGDLEFIDSAGLGMLLIIRDKLNAKNGGVTLRGSQGQVEKMLKLGNFDALFTIE